MKYFRPFPGRELGCVLLILVGGIAGAGLFQLGWSVPTEVSYRFPQGYYFSAKLCGLTLFRTQDVPLAQTVFPLLSPAMFYLLTLVGCLIAALICKRIWIRYDALSEDEVSVARTRQSSLSNFLSIPMGILVGVSTGYGWDMFGWYGVLLYGSMPIVLALGLNAALTHKYPPMLLSAGLVMSLMICVALVFSRPQIYLAFGSLPHIYDEVQLERGAIRELKAVARSFESIRASYSGIEGIKGKWMTISGTAPNRKSLNELRAAIEVNCPTLRSIGLHWKVDLSEEKAIVSGDDRDVFPEYYNKGKG